MHLEDEPVEETGILPNAPILITMEMEPVDAYVLSPRAQSKGIYEDPIILIS